MSHSQSTNLRKLKSMSVKTKPSEALRLVTEKFPHFDFTNSKYLGANKPFQFICPEHGEVIASQYYKVFKSAYGCPACGKAQVIKPLADETWLSRLKEARPDFTFTLDVEPHELEHLSKNSQRLKMTRVSAPCGHTWVTTCASIIDQKSGCNVCQYENVAWKPRMHKALAARWTKYREAKALGIDLTTEATKAARLKNVAKAHEANKIRFARGTQTTQNTQKGA